jgi:hypothetical protein
MASLICYMISQVVQRVFAQNNEMAEDLKFADCGPS